MGLDSNSCAHPHATNYCIEPIARLKGNGDACRYVLQPERVQIGEIGDMPLVSGIHSQSYHGVALNKLDDYCLAISFGSALICDFRWRVKTTGVQQVAICTPDNGRPR